MRTERKIQQQGWGDMRHMLGVEDLTSIGYTRREGLRRAVVDRGNSADL